MIECMRNASKTDKNDRIKVSVAGWIPVSERLPECCGYPVLLTVENKFNQRFVCKAFTNYMKEGKPLFYTNEKEYCKELTSSKLNNVWKPIAWMPLPEPYKESEEYHGEINN